MLVKKMVIIEKLWLLLQKSVFVNFSFPFPLLHPQDHLSLKQEGWFAAASLVSISVTSDNCRNLCLLIAAELLP